MRLHQGIERLDRGQACNYSSDFFYTHTFKCYIHLHKSFIWRKKIGKKICDCDSFLVIHMKMYSKDIVKIFTEQFGSSGEAFQRNGFFTFVEWMKEMVHGVG